MTLYLDTQGSFTPWAGEALTSIKHPLAIETLWTDQQLAAIKLYRPAPADPIPAGMISAGLSVQRIGGVVKYVHDIAIAPLDERIANAPQDLFGGPTLQEIFNGY